MEVFVQALAGVLFHMGASHAYHLLLLAHQDFQLAVLDNRQVHLADLVALGEVRIEVVLAREHVFLVDLGVQRQAQADGLVHRGLVQHRQHAGEGQFHRGGLSVRLGAEGGAGAGENLGDGIELHMHLDTDDDFPFHGRKILFDARTELKRRPRKRKLSRPASGA